MGTMRDILSFDIEISDVFDLQPHEDFEKYAPFHISVAATAIVGGEEKHWYSEGEDGIPQLNLSREHAQELLEYLAQKQKEGVMVCAWNGLKFDFQWLGHQAENVSLAAQVALDSYDPMFQFFNIAGFPVGLVKVAKAMNVGQEKTMDGSEAPTKWRAGEYEQVKKYVLGDCQITNQVVLAIQQARQVEWVNSRGERKAKPMPILKPVRQVIADPGPDQSWMNTPIQKTKFYDWTVDTIR